jgi:hypothetical protein
MSDRFSIRGCAGCDPVIIARAGGRGFDIVGGSNWACSRKIS